MQTPKLGKVGRTDGTRDAVAIAVEDEMRGLARDAGMDFTVDEQGKGNVAVTFGSSEARGESRDIAILRLANVLIDDTRYGSRLVGALKGVSGL